MVILKLFIDILIGQLVCQSKQGRALHCKPLTKQKADKWIMGNVVICKKHIMSNLRTIVIIRIMIIITITTCNKRILESIKAIVLTHEERASVGLPGVVLGVPLPDKCVNICRGRQSWLKYVNSEHCDAFYDTILLWWSYSNTARRKSVRGRGLCVKNSLC